MGLESATYIHQLNSANPTASDQQLQGDDHIRLIKSTLQATLPNVTGVVTPTHTELNYVDGVTSAIQTQLDGKSGTGHTHSYLPLSGGTLTGEVNFGPSGVGRITTNGDVFCVRSGGTTGVVYLESTGNKYLYYNGTNYSMPGAALYLGGLLYGNGGGSGLGAITISTGNPSGGSSGDLWLKY
jgi:hypothetical protein